MVVVTPQHIQNKRVLLRLDLDVPLRLVFDPEAQTRRASLAQGKLSSQNEWEVVDDFRLKAGLPTLKLCLEYAQEVIVMGHIGRPEGQEVPELSVEPIYDWLKEELERLGIFGVLGEKIKLLENLRFEVGEESGDLEYARQLASLGEVFVNEAFATHHPAASTTVLPTLLPHFAGLRFATEVEVLSRVRENPGRPLVVIIGGVKLEDKLPVVEAMAKISDYVLVGGKIAGELAARGPVGLSCSGGSCRSGISGASSLVTTSLRSTPEISPPRHPPSPPPATPRAFSASPADLPNNILVGDLNEEGTDVTEETISGWKGIIDGAKMVVWNGPMGRIDQRSNIKDQKFETEKLGSEKGTYELAKMIVESKAETIVGGGDTVGYLERVGLLERFVHPEQGRRGFVSTGGGAMLKFLTEGTLPTIKALNDQPSK